MNPVVSSSNMVYRYYICEDLPLDVPYDEVETEPEIGTKRIRPQYLKAFLPLKYNKNELGEEIPFYLDDEEENEVEPEEIITYHYPDEDENEGNL